ncbi:MAG: tetratricopeptide repeat protein [Flavobacteriales bacterium]|nr:tetratricopeptide repeat protein [Flavobacteriales bacterium]
MDQFSPHKIFEVGPCLSKEKLLNYHSGSLSSHESNTVEKHLLSCEMCMDAMEGITLSTSPVASIGKIDTGIKILTGTVAAGSFLNWRSGMAIAATLVGVLLGLFWLLNDVAPNQNLAENKPQTKQEKVEEIKNLEKQDESKTISDSIVKITTSGAAKKPVSVQTHSIVYQDELQDEVVEEVIEEYNTEEFEVEEILAETVTVLATAKAMTTSGAINVVSAKEVSYNWADENTTESEDILTIVSEEMVAKKNEISNTLPTTYIKELLVVDYSNIYSEDDLSPRAEPMSKSARIGVEAELAQESTPAAFENDDKYAEAQEKSMTIEKEYTYETILEKGLVLYKKKKYTRAINQFYLILEKYPEDHNALFYTGLSYFGMNRYNKAIENFDTVYLLNKTPFKADAEWQKALVFNAKGDTEKAKIPFQKIVSDKGYYTDLAKKELRNL